VQRGDRGPEVAAVQRELAALGYDVGKIDGIAGPRTLAAWGAHQRSLAAGVVNLVALCDGRYRQGAREWAKIDSITLHQTAGDLGERPERWARWPVRNKKTKQIENASLKAHVGVTRGGQILLVNPLDQRVPHGNGFNARSVGIECSGTYEGIEGDRSTWWQPKGVDAPQRPTPELIEAARRAVRWICAEVAARGGRVRYLYAHRQSRASRLSDPGQVLWREVALWAEAEGLLETRPGYTVGTGRPIPAAWGGEGPY
jgi:hypothetical protein